MGIIKNGLMALTSGILIIAEIPHAVVKAVFGKKENKKTEVKVTEVDINTLPKENQDWIRGLYNKTNGIKEEEP